MKLHLALVAAIADAAVEFTGNGEADGPKKGIKEGKSKPKNSGPPMVHCSQPSGSNYYSFYGYYGGSYGPTVVSSTSLDHGLSGSVSLDNYVNDLYCYVDFASECDGQGVDIEFTRMAIEPSSWALVNGSWIRKDSCYYDSVKFMYTDANGDTQYTEEDCGIYNGDAWSLSYLYSNKPATTKLSLVGTDMKMVFDSDYSIHGGFVDFNWQCRSYGNDICPSKFDGSADSGCYTQSGLWSPGKQVTCSMDNAACMTTTCGATSINAFFRADLFHTNDQDSDSFADQLAKGTRAIYREGSTTPLVENAPCGYTVNGNGIEINWDYAECQVAPSLNGDKIEYGVRLSSPGNEPGYETIEFYVDTLASATCQYDRDVEIDADGFFINQEDVNVEDSKYGSLLKNFKCLFFEDANAKNQIKDHNIVNMGERLHGRVRSKNNGGFGLVYKLQRVTFTDASGTLNPAPKFHVIGGGSGGMGSTVVKAAVQKSKYVPNKPYWREVGRNMKFSFLSFGFEHLADQNEVDIKCRIKIDIDPVMFPEAALGGEGTRTLGGEAEYDYDEAGWGSDDYYDEDY